MRISTLLVLVAALGLAACDSDSGSATTPDTFALDVSNLPALQNGFHYENWLLTPGGALPAGKFNVDTDGNLVSLSGARLTGFDVPDGGRSATAFVVTVEPAGDTDTAPASTHVLAGAFSGGSSALTTSAPQALGDAFTSATGNFILTTPTTASTDDDLSGVWFIDTRSGGPMAGLSLPTLPEGWAYEGWVVQDGKPLTTGRFLSASEADQSAPFSGPQSGPPFPGEDFVTNAPSGFTFPTDLRGSDVVLTIEPMPDDSPMPFALVPLRATIGQSVMPGQTQAMTNNAATLPSGSARFR